MRRLFSNRILAFLLLAVCFACGLLFRILKPSEIQPSIRGVEESSGMSILIQVDEKKLYLLQDGVCIKKYAIATGKASTPSPVGDWVITSKGGQWGQGFGSRWLGLNVTWGKYGIHGTNMEGSIGWAASHGCIRMRNKDVIDLYDRVKVGTPVAIRNGAYGPFGAGFRTLRPGSRGADVMAIQQRLKELGYFIGEPNGIYGEGTKSALVEFLKSKGLKPNDAITHDTYVAMGFLEFD